jgi:hypothetical protein
MADSQKTTDLTPEAEKGDHDLMEIRDKEKPKRPVDLTPEAEKGEHDLLEVQNFRDGGVAEARGMKSTQLSGRNGCKTY